MKHRRIVCLIVLCMLITLLVGCGGSGNSGEDAKKPGSQGTTADSGMNWKDQYDLGIRLLNEGRYEEAILAFTAAIQINPKSAQSYADRANAYVAWADAVVQDAYAALGEGETLVWSDIMVPTSDGNKTVEDLYQNAMDDFAVADKLITDGESTDELDDETRKEMADKQEEIQKLIDEIRNEVIKPAGRLPLGYRVEYDNPPNGIVPGWYKYHYDAKGRLIGESFVADDGTEYGMEPIYYDANGHELPIKDVGEYVELDANGLLIAMGYSSDSVDTYFTYDAKGNLITVEVNDYGYTSKTEYVYDDKNRPTQEYYYTGDELYVTSSYIYDAAGNLIQIQDVMDYDGSNPTYQYLNYQYNDAGQKTYYEYLDENGNPYVWASYTYNSEGELISEYWWQDPDTSYSGPYTQYYIYE